MALLPLEIEDTINGLLEQAQSAISSQNADQVASAGQAINAFFTSYRAEMEADTETWQGDLDQLDAAKSQLSALYATIGPNVSGMAAANSATDQGYPVGTSPAASFVDSLGSSFSETKTQVAAAVNTAATKTGAALGFTGQALLDFAGKLTPVLYILAIGLGLALIVGVFIYAGGTA